jgi:hypothetical protein
MMYRGEQVESKVKRADIIHALKQLLTEFAKSDTDDADKKELEEDINHTVAHYKGLCDNFKEEEYKQKHVEIIKREYSMGNFDESLNPVPRSGCFPNTKGLECVFEILDCPSKSALGKCISMLVLLVIAVSVAAFCIETEESFCSIPPECHAKLRARMMVTDEDCRPVPWPIFQTIETICIVLFTIEYIPRILLAHKWTYRPPTHPECDPLDCPPSWYKCDPLVGKPFQGPFQRTLSYATEPVSQMPLPLAHTPQYLPH